MAKFNQEVEDRMLDAIKAVKEGEDGLSINKIAQKYSVKSQSLRRRLAGHGSVKNNGGRNRALSSDQMKTLFAFLDRQRSLNIPLGKEMVLAAAQRILDSDGSKHELGRRWYDRMIKDHPQYKVAVKMGPKPVVAGVLDHLENLIKTQLPGDYSVVDVLTHLGSPLVSVAVLEAGEITSRVLGDPRPGNAEFRIMGAAKPYNNETLFQACSISKAITSLAVFKLAQEGTLNLDQPIYTYLNAEQLSLISTPQTEAFICQITLKMLLSHTSGLSVGGFGGYNSTTIPTISQILSGEPPANNPQVSLLRMPGQAFSYSGGGYVVIQLILETVLQKPFHQIMDEVVLKPLKMTRSTFSILPAIEKNFAPVYLTGKNPSDPVHHLFPESAAAGLWTTPADLLRVITTIQFSLDSDEFLETEWAEIMLQEIGSNGMAHGWFAKKDGISFGHAGSNNPGFRCHVMGYADLDKTEDDDEDEDMDDRRSVPNDCGIAIMTSSELGGIVREKVLAAIPYLKGWPAVPHSFGLSEVAIPFVDRSKQIDDRSVEWCGVWTPGPWSIVVDNGFKLQYSNFPSVPLVPAAIPPKAYDDGSSIDLVADGLDIMIRLGWKSSGESRTKIVELWQNGSITMLELEPLEPSAS